MKEAKIGLITAGYISAFTVHAFILARTHTGIESRRILPKRGKIIKYLL